MNEPFFPSVFLQSSSIDRVSNASRLAA